jgi:hypothetical protein
VRSGIRPAAGPQQVEYGVEHLAQVHLPWPAGHTAQQAASVEGTGRSSRCDAGGNPDPLMPLNLFLDGL